MKNLDILWTWAVVGARPSFLHNSLYSKHALLCSTLAAKRLYPEARRRFLVDQETYDLLEKNNWLSLWDSVEIIDFPKDTRPFINYYATPKIYTYRFIENPTLILDVEAVLKKRVPLEERYLDRVQGPYWQFDEVGERELKNWFSKYPKYVRDFYPIVGNNYISAAHLYIPSREVGEHASKKCIEHLDRLFSECEMQFGGGPAVYLEDGFITHCFEEKGGVVFMDSWWECFHHRFEEKHENKANVNMLLEQYAGCKVYDTYIKQKKKSLC